MRVSASNFAFLDEDFLTIFLAVQT